MEDDPRAPASRTDGAGSSGHARVVVTGYGLLTSLGASAEESWRRLCDGATGARETARFDGARYGGALVCAADIPERAPRHGADGVPLDDASRILLLAVEEALSGRTDMASAPIFLSTTLGGMDGGTRFYRRYHRAGTANGQMASLKDYFPYMQARRLREAFGLRGPVQVVSNACASGANAIGLAWLMLRHGFAERALVAGYDVVSDFVFAGFHALRLTSRTGCRPFSEDRDGLVLGEAAAALILETESAARRDGRHALAEVRGYAAACEAYHTTQPQPDGRGARDVMRSCLSVAGLSAGEIDSVNAHGTGTAQNDSMEARALADLFADCPRVLVTANKAGVGHTLGAAGTVEAVFSILSIRDGIVPPVTDLIRPIPELGPIRVPTQSVASDVRHVLSTSYGFGGTNACLALSRIGEGR